MKILGKKVPYLLILILVALPLIFARINGDFVAFPDELIIEEVSYRMAQSGKFATPIFKKQVWLERPPLYFWLTAPFYQIFPPMPFIRRIVSAASAFGLVITLFFFSQPFLPPHLSFLSSLAILTNYYFLTLAKAGNHDLLLTFFLYLALTCYLKQKRQKKVSILFGLFFGLAFMTRSLLALPFLLVIAFDLFWEEKKSSFFKTKKWQSKFIQVLTGLLISGVLILPWHLKMALSYPDKFLNQYLIFNLVIRFWPQLTPYLFLGTALVSPPLIVIFTFLLSSPLLLLAPLAIIKTVSRFRKINPLERILVIWSVFLPLPFLFSKKVAPRYLIQILPALLITTLFYLKNSLRPKKSPLKTFILIVFFLINFSLGPFLFFSQKDPSADLIKAQKLARQIAGPGETIYSWQNNHFVQNIFSNYQPTAVLTAANFKTVFDQNKEIILLIPKKEVSQIPKEIHTEEIIVYQNLALYLLSYSR